MAQDFALQIRRAILPRLKANGPVTSLIPAASIYPVTVPAKPAFPFIRYGASNSVPFLATGLDSSKITVAIHAFTKDLKNGDAVISTAEDQAHAMSAAIGACLDGTTLDIGGGYKVRTSWTGSTILIDGDEPGAWHAVVNLRASVAG